MSNSISGVIKIFQSDGPFKYDRWKGSEMIHEQTMSHENGIISFILLTTPYSHNFSAIYPCYLQCLGESECDLLFDDVPAHFRPNILREMCILYTRKYGTFTIYVDINQCVYVNIS